MSSGNFPSIGYSYSYDAKGNLTGRDLTYDDKKNFRQTSKVWMLIHKNFSRNNAFAATQYNSEGYPTVFPAPSATDTPDAFLRRSLNFKTIEYSCTVSSSAAQ